MAMPLDEKKVREVKSNKSNLVCTAWSELAWLKHSGQYLKSVYILVLSVWPLNSFNQWATMHELYIYVL